MKVIDDDVVASGWQTFLQDELHNAILVNFNRVDELQREDLDLIIIIYGFTKQRYLPPNPAFQNIINKPNVAYINLSDQEDPIREIKRTYYSIKRQADEGSLRA